MNVSGVATGAAWSYSTDGDATFTTGAGTSFTLTGDGVKAVLVNQSWGSGDVSPNASLTFTLDPSILFQNTGGQAAIWEMNGVSLVGSALLGANPGPNWGNDARPPFRHLDNLPAHKSQAAEQAIRERGAWLLFLPPYSPDLNPIEMAFAKLKAHLRAMAMRTIDELWKAIGQICDLFTPQEWQTTSKPQDMDSYDRLML